jgi:hypothetical protein
MNVAPCGDWSVHAVLTIDDATPDSGTSNYIIMRGVVRL